MKVINFAARQPVALGQGWTLYRSHHTDFKGAVSVCAHTLGRFGLLVRYPNGTSRWLISSVRFDGLRLSSHVFKVDTGFAFVEIDSCKLEGICARIEKLFEQERLRLQVRDDQYWASRRALRMQVSSAVQYKLFDTDDSSAFVTT